MPHRSRHCPSTLGSRSSLRRGDRGLRPIRCHEGIEFHPREGVNGSLHSEVRGIRQPSRPPKRVPERTGLALPLGLNIQECLTSNGSGATKLLFKLSHEVGLTLVQTNRDVVGVAHLTPLLYPISGEMQEARTDFASDSFFNFSPRIPHPRFQNRGTNVECRC